MRDSKWEATMSSRKVTESKSRQETVVSVRFAVDEVVRLRHLAEARDIPLSTVIRRAALASLASPPFLAVMPSINQGAAASAWMLYDSGSAQVKVGSTENPAAATLRYRTSVVNTA
jgi:hypothetical protein